MVLEKQEHHLDRLCEIWSTQTVREERNMLHAMKRRKADWIGRILRSNCLLQHTVEGKIEGRTVVLGRRGRRRKQLLADLKETRGYWNLNEEAIDRTL
jgi:hypothetical protein